MQVRWPAARPDHRTGAPRPAPSGAPRPTRRRGGPMTAYDIIGDVHGTARQARGAAGRPRVRRGRRRPPARRPPGDLRRRPRRPGRRPGPGRRAGPGHARGRVGPGGHGQPRVQRPVLGDPAPGAARRLPPHPPRAAAAPTTAASTRPSSTSSARARRCTLDTLAWFRTLPLWLDLGGAAGGPRLLAPGVARRPRQVGRAGQRRSATPSCSRPTPRAPRPSTPWTSS